VLWLDDKREISLGSQRYCLRVLPLGTFDAIYGM
jgi:hypothetical protein